MKKNEKIELKKVFTPILSNIFERDKKEILLNYSFLETDDDDIEDDVEILVEAPKEYNPFDSREKYSGTLKTYHGECRIISEGYNHREEDVIGHGIALDFTSSWLISNRNRHFNVVCSYNGEQTNYLKKHGYIEITSLI